VKTLGYKFWSRTWSGKFSEEDAYKGIRQERICIEILMKRFDGNKWIVIVRETGRRKGPGEIKEKGRKRKLQF